MTKVYAFSGIHNTGKTTCINEISTLLHEKGIKVYVLQEVARLFISDIKKDTSLMQHNINAMEDARLDYLLNIKGKELFDIILADRTIKDNLGYSAHLTKKGIMNDEHLIDRNECPYDTIISFQEPIKKSKHWDEDKEVLDAINEKVSTYPTEILKFQNYKENREEILALFGIQISEK